VQPATDKPSFALLWLLAGGLLLLLAGCSVRTVIPGHDDDLPEPGYTRPSPANARGVPDAAPRAEPRSRYGNPDSYQVHGRTYRVMDDSRGFVERGIASWYGPKFHGRLTSSREPYDMYKMTAAHKHLPLPTYAQVTNLENGRSVVVRINDRGPFAHDRIIDLSYSAALKLDMISKGTARVEIRAIDPSRPRDTAPPARRPTRVADASPPPADNRGIYLQAGAFASEANAHLLHSRLREAVDPLIGIDTRPDPARALFRVRLGPLQSLEEAIRLASKLDRLGVKGARVVTD
jgi:rare lipoprotein A